MEVALLAEIVKIFEYHDWSNRQVLEAATQLSISEQESELGGSFASFIETLRHILLVEFLFIHRWQELEVHRIPEWATLDQMKESWLSLEVERNKFLAVLDDGRLSAEIHYADTRGRAVTISLWQALFQCVNHATFHRGQLVEKLRKLDKLPPATDFVLFCRSE
jgi:uncharacterized damage-inducible protein DinB